MNNTSTASRRHLDIGCGTTPQNPYGKAELFGIDIRQVNAAPGVEIRCADLTVSPIPFPDNFFGSVSAFDYLEHVPRIIVMPDGKATAFPLIRLMSEVWRVLAPGGRFYALTPVYPHAEVFQDPTHVNIMTPETHWYFCGDSPKGAMYGFEGRFRHLRTEFAVKKDALSASAFTVRQRLRRFKYSVQGRLFHFLWELEAVKGEGALAGHTDDPTDD